MRTYSFVTVDVFTDRRFGGNQLAVFPEASGLSDAEMQDLAAEFNLSETTFVLPPADAAHTARVRIFNTTAEMPFAGHPNVGTGYVLARLGRASSDVLLFEELAGIVEVEVSRGTDGTPTGARIAAPQPLSLGTELPVDAIAACAGLAVSDISTAAHPPMVVSVGNPFVVAEVAGEALSAAAPDVGAFRRTVEATPALQGRLALYLYTQEGDRLRARMFAPLAGTFEDAATGSAACPLAALRLSLSGGERGAFDIVQGVEMGRPSLLQATAWRAGDGIRASVGGGCVPVLRGEVEL